MDDSAKKIGTMGALAVLSQIPVVSAFSKFCEDYVNSNWQERIDLWREETIKRLSMLDQEMEQKIRETSNFSSILATAQRGALEDKVGLYANTVINAIKNENVENAKIHIFLNILKECSLLHIEILKDISISKPPVPQIRAGGISVSSTLLIDLRIKYKNKELLEAILKNLSENHLIYIAQNKIGATEPTIITDFGKEFLQFISEQESANG